MDSVGIISIATGVGLAAFGIYLSIKFYLETAKLQERMVEILAKIETTSLSTQQIQSELVRSAWDRHVAGPGPEEAVRVERTAASDVGEEGSEEAAVEEGTVAEREDVVAGFAARISSLDRVALVALRIPVADTKMPSRFVRVPRQEMMKTEQLFFGEDSRSYVLRRSRFEEGLRALAERGLVEGVRVEEKPAEYFISLSRDFVSYWFEHRGELSAFLYHWVTAAVAREGFAAAEPIL